MPRSEMSVTVLESAASVPFGPSLTDDTDILAGEVKVREERAAAWDRIIDGKLIEWGGAADDFEVDGLVPPSGTSISVALRLVKRLRKNDWPLPSGIIPDGEGGIVVENRHDPLYQRIEIDDQGRASLVTFHACQLVERVPIDIE